MAHKFAVFDIDGTVIRWQLFHGIVDELLLRGHMDAEAGERIRQARMTWKRRSDSDSYHAYEHVVWKSYVDAVKHLGVAEVDAAVDSVFEQYKDQTYTYTRDLIRDLKSRNYLLFAVSGSHHEIVSKFAAYYGFDDAIGTIYTREGQSFTGEEIDVVTKKGEALTELVEKHAASWKDSLAIGDSKSDASMLTLVENPIAFNPNQDLLDIARREGWKVVLERKNVVYQLESANGQYILA